MSILFSRWTRSFQVCRLNFPVLSQRARNDTVRCQLDAHARHGEEALAGMRDKLSWLLCFTSSGSFHRARWSLLPCHGGLTR